jgi:hypothetical protein
MRQIGGNMKNFFIATLVFLFLSCGNSAKHTEVNDSSSENPDTDNIESVDYVEPLQGICLEEPCKDVENSTGKCLLKGTEDNYVCVCKENFVWFPNKKTCEPISSFKGLSCTGQTKCYDNEKEIPCPKAGEPFFGQDANYAEERECIPQNFTIKHYEFGNTVTDNNSGLEWIQKVSSRQDNYCNTWGEYSDWRIATFQDYNSIIDSGTLSPTINEAYFPETPSDFFYTSMYIYEAPYSKVSYIPPTYVVIEGINFQTGLSESNTYSITQSHKKEYFRYVRDLMEKQESSTLTFSSDEYKIATLLPQKLIMANFQNKNWEEALEYCENLSYAGISDWRLPNRNEAYFVFNQYESSKWSSTSYTNDPAQAIVYTTVYNTDILYSSYNYVGTKNKTQKAGTACVAFDPCQKGEVWNGEKCASFDELGLKSDGRSCKQEGYSWGNSHCEKTCDDDLCKDKAHSTGLCLQVINDSVSQRIKCQCEENYFIYQYSYYSEFECVNPCEPNPCTGEGSTGNCIAANASNFTCDCQKGYYFDTPKCVSVTKNDCYADYYDAACANNMAGIMWSSTSSSALKWNEAREYCENLNEAGYTDWRLPKIEELWTFAKSCNNIPQESCEASESSGCLSEECIAQCKCKIYQENYNTADYLWSSSFKSDDPEKVIIFYKYYAILQFFDIKTDAAKVKCVRNIE